MNDDGLAFHVIVRKAEGSSQTRETTDRRALLDWIDRHVDHLAGDVVMAVGVEATTGPAITAMIAAIRVGAARLEDR